MSVVREENNRLVQERDDLRWLVILLLKNIHPFADFSFIAYRIPRSHEDFLEWAGRIYGSPLVPVKPLLIGPHCQWCKSHKHLGLDCPERPPV